MVPFQKGNDLRLKNYLQNVSTLHNTFMKPKLDTKWKVCPVVQLHREVKCVRVGKSIQ